MAGHFNADPFRNRWPAEKQREIGIDELKSRGPRVGEGIRQIGGEGGANHGRQGFTGDELPTIAGPQTLPFGGSKSAGSHQPDIPAAVGISVTG